MKNILPLELSRDYQVLLALLAWQAGEQNAAAGFARQKVEDAGVQRAVDVLAAGGSAEAALSELPASPLREAVKKFAVERQAAPLLTLKDWFASDVATLSRAYHKPRGAFIYYAILCLVIGIGAIVDALMILPGLPPDTQTDMLATVSNGSSALVLPAGCLLVCYGALSLAAFPRISRALMERVRNGPLASLIAARTLSLTPADPAAVTASIDADAALQRALPAISRRITALAVVTGTAVVATVVITLLATYTRMWSIPLGALNVP